MITANEGSAIALAAGYHMATKKFAMVYLQVRFFRCRREFARCYRLRGRDLYVTSLLLVLVFRILVWVTA